MIELLDLYLDGLDADGALSPKTRFDYRHYADDYVRPHLGTTRVRDVTPEVILAWQRKLTQGGRDQAEGRRGRQAKLPGKALSPNTVRLARAPLSGAFKLAMSIGLIAANPIGQVPDPGPSGRSRSTGPRSRPGSSSAHGGRPHVADLGLPARLGAPDRRAGVAAVAERRPRDSGGCGSWSSPRLSVTTSFRRPERAVTPFAPSTSTTASSASSKRQRELQAEEALAASDYRGERVRLHQGRRAAVPPPGLSHDSWAPTRRSSDFPVSRLTDSGTPAPR